MSFDYNVKIFLKIGLKKIENSLKIKLCSSDFFVHFYFLIMDLNNLRLIYLTNLKRQEYMLNSMLL